MEDIIKIIFRKRMIIDLDENIEDFLEDINEMDDEDYRIFLEMVENNE